MKWFVIGFASFILFFFSSFLPSKYAFAQSYCDQGDVCMDVYDELACQNTFSGRWMVDGWFRPEPLEDGDCCVSNGCSDTQYCTFYSYPAYINYNPGILNILIPIISRIYTENIIIKRPAIAAPKSSFPAFAR